MSNKNSDKQSPSIENYLKEKDAFKEALAANNRTYANGNTQNMIDDMAKHMEKHQSRYARTAWLYRTEDQKRNIN